MYKAIQAVNNKNNYTAVLLDANELSNLQIREVNIPVFNCNLWWPALHGPILSSQIFNWSFPEVSRGRQSRNFLNCMQTCAMNKTRLKSSVIPTNTRASLKPEHNVAVLTGLQTLWGLPWTEQQRIWSAQQWRNARQSVTLVGKLQYHLWWLAVWLW